MSVRSAMEHIAAMEREAEARKTIKKDCCAGKRAYKTAAQADEVCARVLVQVGLVVHTYLCPKCNQHHTGHRKADYLADGTRPGHTTDTITIK